MTYYLFKIYVITVFIILVTQYTVPFIIKAFEIDKKLDGEANTAAEIEELPYWKKIVYMMMYNQHINISSTIWYAIMLGIGLTLTSIISIQNTVFPGYGEQIIFLVGLSVGFAVLINIIIRNYIKNFSSKECKSWYNKIETQSTDYWAITTGSQTGS